MSPPMFNQESKMINGFRPTPLKISKESYVINKPAAKISSFVAPHCASKAPVHQRTQPVIIYTHSPKVIHTQARDFMALVQKLTGLSQSNDYTDDEEAEETTNSKAISAVYNDDNKSSSSVVTEENVRGCSGDDDGIGSAHIDHLMKEFLNPPQNKDNDNNKYFADIPLFTPTGTDFFCSPKPLYRYGDNSSFASPGIGNLSSPSVLEFLKGLPEY